jgi:hypothetical protein
MYKWEGDFNTVSSTRFEAPPPCEIYPNPFTDRITLTSPVSMDQYSLYTIEGRLVQSGKLGASDATLDLAAYGSAIFLLEITYGDGHKSSHKIIRGS